MDKMDLQTIIMYEQKLTSNRLSLTFPEGNICQNSSLLRYGTRASNKALYICKNVSQRMMNLPLAFSSWSSSPLLNIKSKYVNRSFNKLTVFAGRRDDVSPSCDPLVFTIVPSIIRHAQSLVTNNVHFSSSKTLKKKPSLLLCHVQKACFR